MNLVSSLRSRGVEVLVVPKDRSWRNFVNVIANSKAVFINGEGTIHHSRPAGRNLLTVIPFCETRTISCTILNTTWQSNNDEISNLAAGASNIYVRESRSKLSLQKIGLESTIVPDLSFLSSFPLTNQDGHHTGLSSEVVFTDSVDPVVTEALYSAHKSCENSQFLSIMGSSEEYLVEPYKGLQELLRQSRLSLGMRRRSLLYLVSSTRNILRRLRKFDFINPPRPEYQMRQVSELPDFLNTIRNAKMVVTGRFHVVAMCIMLRVPFIATSSNSHKIEGLLEDAGLSHRFVRHQDLIAIRGGGDLPRWTTMDTKLAIKYHQWAQAQNDKMLDTLVGKL